MSSFLNLSGRRRIELIRQSESAECGLACLAMISGFHGSMYDLAAMRSRFQTSMKGMTLNTVMNLAGAIGLTSRPVRCELDEMRGLQLPAMLHWGGNHFVVLERMGSRRCLIHDPATGSQTFRWNEVSERFTGIALELSPGPNFRPQTERKLLKLSTLLRLTGDTMKGLLQALVLSIVIEILLLASPFYVQLAIDDAIVKGDANFINVLAAAFFGLLVFRTISSCIRSLTLQFVSQTLSFDMQSRVFHHMIRLPLQWYQKRHVGDIQSRFGSIHPIQSFISNGAISGMLDGILSIAVVVLMCLYSLILTSVVLTSVVLYIIIRVSTIQLQRRVAGDAITAHALEQSKFLESVRAIGTIKSCGVERTRENTQRNAIATSINSSIRSGNVRIAYDTVAVLIDGTADILIVYIGALAVMKGNLTLGMLTAFLAYKQQFYSRITNLVEQVVNWRLLNIDLGRLADIALSQPDKALEVNGHSSAITGRLQCRNLSFSYAYGEAPVVIDANLDIEAGDYVAITGPSGCGKSTLVKLLAGLYVPSSGEVLLDGRPIPHWDHHTLRSAISIVTQEDTLLAGTIADNISVFAEDRDMEWVRTCANLAQIESDVEKMAMGFETLVGDLGSSLSAGQKQRVLIARALYRRPKILILDEGTSHLDVFNEKAVNDALAALRITRIVVAHRPETVKSASRRLVLIDGKVFDADKLKADFARRGPSSSGAVAPPSMGPH